MGKTVKQKNERGIGTSRGNARGGTKETMVIAGFNRNSAWPADKRYLLEYKLRDDLSEGCIVEIGGDASDHRQVVDGFRRSQNSDGKSDQELAFSSCKKHGVFFAEIVNTQHPANGELGLFAKKKIAQDAWILNYIGEVCENGKENGQSDYTLKLGMSLAIDAENCGNEARFINDFRNTGVSRPNACFREYRDSKGILRIGIFAMQGIRSGEEILVTYGKGFWEQRGLI
mmetsp:Transcript_13397/g.24040  ORF Transcript_13397/g.24040 Transcript_13397/m.24040 type:complete len:229 (+) Transcript_13397:1615-2301(+)